MKVLSGQLTANTKGPEIVFLSIIKVNNFIDLELKNYSRMKLILYKGIFVTGLIYFIVLLKKPMVDAIILSRNNCSSRVF